MSKRIKRVFGTSSQVLHLWANQTQDDARCRNVFFEGTSCYSYGPHYELGRLVAHPTGKRSAVRVALINDTGYSVTTSKHIGEAWHAVAHMPRLKTTGIVSVERALEENRARIIGEMERHFRRRSFWTGENWRESCIKREITEFNKTCDALHAQKFKVRITAKYIERYTSHIKARLKRESELESPEAKAKRDAERVKRSAKAIEIWRNGGRLTSAVQAIEPQMLRVSGDTVETSRGAQVPLKDARTLLKAIIRGEAKTGDSVGPFTLRSANATTIQVGCHTVALDEAKRVLLTPTQG